MSAGEWDWEAVPSDSVPSGEAEATAPTHDPWAKLATTVPDDWYRTQPPPRKWLLRDARTAKSDGVLPMGKAAQLIGEGGISKTMAAIQLAVAVATGTAWLGVLSVVAPGRVLLLLGEEDVEEAQRRIYRAANAAGATPPEGSIVVMPLFGVTVPLIEKTEAANLIASPFLYWLRGYVAAGNFALVIVDPTSRFAGLDAEKDNAAATVYVQALESLATLGPTVLNTHHVNKISRGKDGTVTASSGRGSSAFVDGCRWQCALSQEELDHNDPDVEERLGEVVTLSFTKSNYSKRGAPILLRRDPDNGGVLLPLDEVDVDTVDKARAAAPTAVARARSTAAADSKVEADAAKVLAVIQASPGVGTRKVRDKCRLAREAVGRAVELLLERNEIRDLVSLHGAREDHHYYPREDT